MDIHQAAKALVKQIDETGEFPNIVDVGLCYLLKKAGAIKAYSEVSDLACGSHVWYISPRGEWNETRMTFLALLAETSAEDFEEYAIE